ncbi:BspA family leucine-rich repeat surface protein, partial [Apilactobacillus kunkeei]
AASDVASQGSSSASTTSLSASSSTTSSASVTASSVASNENSSSSSSDWSNSISASDATLSNKNGNASFLDSTTQSVDTRASYDFNSQTGTLSIHSGTVGSDTEEHVDQISKWSNVEADKVKSVVFDGGAGSVKTALNVTGLFANLSNLTSVTATNEDAVDTSATHDMGHLFEGDSSLTNIDAVKKWNVQNVTNMASMFNGDSSLTNVDALEGWNTDSLNQMTWMFQGASSLSDIKGLSGFNTSKVTSMACLFNGTTALSNIDALSGWNVSSVQSLAWMFQNDYNLSNVNALSTWKNTSQLTDMQGMFQVGDDIQNSKLTDVSGLKNLDTSNVTTMAHLFSNNNNLSNISGLENWNTSNVTDTNRMFSQISENTSLTDLSSLGTWDLNKVTDASYMFTGDKGIKDLSPLKNWGMSSLANAAGMFQDGSSIESLSPLSNWHTSNLRYMDFMFNGVSKITSLDGLQTWTNLKYLLTLSGIFQNTTSLKDISQISNWNTPSLTDMSYAFNGAGITDVNDLSTWDTSSVKSLYGTFQDTASLKDISKLSNWNTSNVTSMGYTFNGSGISSTKDISNWNTSNVTSMYGMFQNTFNLSNVDDLDSWKNNLGNLTTTAYMFNNSAITNVNGLANWKTPSLNDMGYMFQQAYNLSDISGLSGWDVSKVVNMPGMLRLTKITNLDALANWQPDSVTSIGFMLEGTTDLTNISGLSTWFNKPNNLQNMAGLFNGASAIESIEPLANWNTSNVTNMSWTFRGMTNVQDLEAFKNWNTSNVTDMTLAISDDRKVHVVDISGWDTRKVDSGKGLRIITEQKIFKLGPNTVNVFVDVDGRPGHDVILAQGTGTEDNPNGTAYSALQLQNKFANTGNPTETYIRITLDQYKDSASASSSAAGQSTVQAGNDNSGASSASSQASNNAVSAANQLNSVVSTSEAIDTNNKSIADLKSKYPENGIINSASTIASLAASTASSAATAASNAKSLADSYSADASNEASNADTLARSASDQSIAASNAYAAASSAYN